MAKKKTGTVVKKKVNRGANAGVMGRPKLVYSYGLDDIAEVCGQTKNAVNKAIHRGILVPDDLLSVACYIAAHASEQTRLEVVNALIRQNEYQYPGRPGKAKSGK